MEKVSKQEYLRNLLGSPYVNKRNREKLREALKHAHEIRKFEIELFWKRANYFWIFIGATYAAYFVIFTSDLEKEKQQEILLMLNFVGILTSWIWYLVNRGSKYWQENWESHIDYLEDEFMGSLYKTLVPNKCLHFGKLTGSYPYSASRLSILISLFSFLGWIFLFLLLLFRDAYSDIFGLPGSIWLALIFIIIQSVEVLGLGSEFWRGRDIRTDGIRRRDRI